MDQSTGLGRNLEIGDPKIFQLRFYFEDFKHESIPLKDVKRGDYDYIPDETKEDVHIPVEAIINDVIPKLPVHATRGISINPDNWVSFFL